MHIINSTSAMYSGCDQFTLNCFNAKSRLMIINNFVKVVWKRIFLRTRTVFWEYILYTINILNEKALKCKPSAHLI